MDGFIEFVYVIMGVLNIVLFFKIWSMTNDVKELKNYFINNNYNERSKQSTPSMSFTKEIKANEERVNDNIDIKEGSIVYGKKDKKKYTVVKVLSNRMLRLDDGSDKPQYDELSIDDVVI